MHPAEFEGYVPALSCYPSLLSHNSSGFEFVEFKIAFSVKDGVSISEISLVISKIPWEYSDETELRNENKKQKKQTKNESQIVSVRMLLDVHSCCPKAS